ncbi:MAG TPA: glycosyltransferase [Bryobacteraceae bacterium]
MLNVLQVAYPFAPVSRDTTGGAEQILSLLDRALVRRGHRSITIACSGSQTEGELVPIHVPPTFDEASRTPAYEALRSRITQTLAHRAVDLIHMHGVDFHEYLPPAGVPVLVTLHLPISYYPNSIFHLSRPDTYLNCVSESQLRTCPPCESLLGTVENGIPLDLFPERQPARRDYTLAMGRICPEKGFHLALQAAKQAGVPLWIAGKVYPYAQHEQYFRQELLPHLSPPHRYLGPVGFKRKVRLLARARCLLLSSLVPETSSLVAMEAMACGTPVVGFPSGVASGIVDPGRTGFIVQSVNEMAAAIAHAGEIDANACRKEARKRFSAERMADRYLEWYARLAGERSSPAMSRGGAPAR